MSSTLTLYEPIRRDSGFFRDLDGVPTHVKRADEIIQVNLDFTADLAGAETISSAAWEDSGITTSSRSLATPVATATVTGTNGETVVTATLSTGRKLQRKLRFVAPGDVGASLARDYRP